MATIENNPDAESIWMINPADNSIVSINPKSDLLIATLSVEGVPMEVVSGPEGIFASIRQNDNQTAVLKVDLQTGQITGILPLKYDDLKSLVLHQGSLWTAAVPVSENAGKESQDTGGGDLIQIDTRSLSVAAVFPLSSTPRRMTSAGDGLWILEDGGTASRFTVFDPVTHQSRNLPDGQSGMAYVYQLDRFTRDNEWVWGTSILNVSRFIYRIDPTDGRLDKIIELGPDSADTPADIRNTQGRVWVALNSQAVVEIDSGTGTVIHRIPLEFPADRIFVSTGSIWAQSHTRGILAQIDPEEGSILALIPTGGRLKPTSTPSPELAPGVVCQGDYPTTLELEGRAKVSLDPPQPNRVRSEPNLDSKILGELQPGEGMTLIEGPVCTDGWVWWKIRSDDHRLTGWMAEGDGDMYWMIPD